MGHIIQSRQYRVFLEALKDLQKNGYEVIKGVIKSNLATAYINRDSISYATVFVVNPPPNLPGDIGRVLYTHSEYATYLGVLEENHKKKLNRAGISNISPYQCSHRETLVGGWSDAEKDQKIAANLIAVLKASIGKQDYQYSIEELNDIRSIFENASNQKSKWVSFLLCLFLGCAGVHKFYEGRIGMGILYLLTFGVFGVGWIIDTFKLLFMTPNPYYV